MSRLVKEVPLGMKSGIFSVVGRDLTTCAELVEEELGFILACAISFGIVTIVLDQPAIGRRPSGFVRLQIEST